MVYIYMHVYVHERVSQILHGRERDSTGYSTYTCPSVWSACSSLCHLTCNRYKYARSHDKFEHTSLDTCTYILHHNARKLALWCSAEQEVSMKSLCMWRWLEPHSQESYNTIDARMHTQLRVLHNIYKWHACTQRQVAQSGAHIHVHVLKCGAHTHT